MSTKEKNESAQGQNKETLIYVNTKDYKWKKRRITFEEVVNIAFPNASKKEFDVTYLRGQSDQEGELLDGESVNVHPNMEFLVTPTNES